MKRYLLDTKAVSEWTKPVPDAGLLKWFADSWGEIVAARDIMGRPIAAMVAFIAATANANDMTLVTRNIADFQPSLTHIISPWLK